ncbi:Lnb N-terminal periplasmic domain-containing protein [Isoalcanivorax beigongshangi]|uniref:DUF4105 domain-containing protein n=1 Tax=Isoalcanivorax beigongshangi TaxID=3238810 RepID=A0ABV4ALP1_9GAMM
MLRVVLTALLGALLALPGSVLATAPAPIDLQQLEQHPRWQALLHINRGATLRQRGNSYVADDAFFLADNGRRQPRAELRASIEQLAAPQSPARCQFPARYRFLAEQLQWPQEMAPFAHCDEYLEWRAEIPTGKAVLIFPAAYLNSPSSMFGHTLLRLDSAEDQGVWLSWAVNFGALTDGSDNSIFYIYRGLAGGYDGYFSIVPYVTKIQDYAHLENRDMWEYELTLDDDELSWLVDHLWELKDIRFDYYFFDENCSFRLLELMEVARPGIGLLDSLRFTEVPVNTVRSIDDAGLIGSRHYRASKSRELNHLADQLSPAARRVARRLADRPEQVIASADYQSYSPEQRRLMAQTAYEYLRFSHRTQERNESVARRSFTLLREIRTLPASALPPLPTPDAPEDGHATKMLSAGGGMRDDNGFGELGLRLTYHDWFDNNPGFLRGAEIEGLNLRLRKEESQRPVLESLQLVNIRSLAPRSAFVKPTSWFVTGGIERAFTTERRRAVRYLEGGPGLSWRWGNFHPYALSLFRIENNSDWDHWVEAGAGARLGMLWYAPGVTLGASAEGYYLTNDAYRHRATLTASVPVGRNNALRLDLVRDGWRDDHDEEIRLAWRHYFR